MLTLHWMESGWIEESTVVEVYMYVIEKEEETTVITDQEVETERVQNVPDIVPFQMLCMFCIPISKRG